MWENTLIGQWRRTYRKKPVDLYFCQGQRNEDVWINNKGCHKYHHVAMFVFCRSTDTASSVQDVIFLSKGEDVFLPTLCYFIPETLQGLNKRICIWVIVFKIQNLISTGLPRNVSAHRSQSSGILSSGIASLPKERHHISTARLHKSTQINHKDKTCNYYI